MPQEDTADYRTLFLDDIPLLDTRSPLEYSQGAFPLAQNIPLMSDEERHLVGIRYKEAGQEAAIALGNELVTGDTRRQRLQAWLAFTRNHPDGYLYCFRGGPPQAAIAARSASADHHENSRGNHRDDCA